MVSVIMIANFILILMSVISYCEDKSYCGTKNNIYKYTLSLAIILSFWLGFSISIPYKPENIIEEKLAVKLENDVQTITYQKYNSKLFNIVNLNLEFGKVINEEKEDVILKTYKGDWYKGIYWDTIQKVVLKEKNDKSN